MCEELDKCYGTDGSYVRVTYRNADGKKRLMPEYNSYHLAKKRCTAPSNNRYEHYSKLGIEFRFTCFAEWWDELGRKPTPKHSVDRIDGNGHYEVGNVRWASLQEQSVNRNNVHSICLTFPDGSVSEFESAAAAALSSDISNESVLCLCKGTKEVVKGYCASFISQ